MDSLRTTDEASLDKITAPVAVNNQLPPLSPPKETSVPLFDMHAKVAPAVYVTPLPI